MIEINVAYDGTSADLSGFGGEDTFFSHVDWPNMTDSSESLPVESGFLAINSGNGTVSPKDLSLYDATGSLPPSTSFTDLATPASALLSTPSDQYETSPMFDGNPVGNEEFWSLFPAETSEVSFPSAPAMFRDLSTGSGKQVIIHPGGEIRKRRSTNASPMIAGTRPSTTAGVSKREKSLAPIVADPEDQVAWKRARNTAAARKSRMKKVEETETYLKRIAELESEVEHWKALALLRHPALES